MTMLMQQNSPRSNDAYEPTLGTVSKNCRHCKISLHAMKSLDEDFCCRGCAGAWQIVNGLGLESFYRMTAASPLKPASKLTKDYSIYDAPEFQAQFTSQDPETSSLNFTSRLLIEGITCFACVWLIRQALERKFATKTSPSTISININQATGTAILNWSPTIEPLSGMIQFIESLGYQVLPHRESLQTNQTTLMRAGVGLFVMMNVMSFALAEYLAGPAGLDELLQRFLRWISLALTTVAMLYTGQEFFTNTWRAILARAPSIDGPILIGLLSAYVWSVISTVNNSGHVYYDSICAIIALVVTGRLIQQNVLRKNQNRLAALMNPRDGWVLAKTSDATEDCWKPVRASAVKRGDAVRILPGEIFPLRATCTVACAEISFEQLKGEADWRTIQQGEVIPAGALNGPAPIDAVAAQNGAESYTLSLARAIESAIHEKGRYNQWSDRAAWLLFLVVFAAAGAVIATVAPQDSQEALSRVVALLLVACPCTFAIGVPLTFGTAMTQALREGILFKSQRSLEKLAAVKTFIFDKTGTLTNGFENVSTWTWDLEATAEDKAKAFLRLAAIDRYSSHHIANATARYARKHGAVANSLPDLFHETQGQGIECRYGTDHLRLGRPSFALINSKQNESDSNKTILSINNKRIAQLSFGDEARVDSVPALESLRSLGQELHILSGDAVLRTNQTAKEMHIIPTNTQAEATPASKALYVRRKKKFASVAMVGNGLNDAGAMSQADIAFAVAGSSSTAMNSADICLLASDLALISRAVIYARDAMLRSHLVFCFALIYNVAGLTLAATGHVTPVVAAILMPISSLTVTHVATSFRASKYSPSKQSAEA